MIRPTLHRPVQIPEICHSPRLKRHACGIPHPFLPFSHICLHRIMTSFFKRSDPSAPQARRAAQGGLASPYERLPADNLSQSSLPPPQQQPGLPPRRNPVPAQPDNAGGASYGSPARQPQQPLPPQRSSGGYDGGYGGGGDHYGEKAEYRPVQPQLQPTPQAPRGYPSQGTGSGRGMCVTVAP